MTIAATVTHDGDVVQHAYEPGCACEACAAERAPKPLTAPLAMILCCNNPPPGCGWCFFCLARVPPRKRKATR